MDGSGYVSGAVGLLRLALGAQCVGDGCPQMVGCVAGRGWWSRLPRAGVEGKTGKTKSGGQWSGVRVCFHDLVMPTLSTPSPAEIPELLFPDSLAAQVWPCDLAWPISSGIKDRALETGGGPGAGEVFLPASALVTAPSVARDGFVELRASIPRLIREDLRETGRGCFC